MSELIPGTRDESESTLVWTLVLATCAVALLVLGGGKCSSVYLLNPAPELPVLYQALFALLFWTRSYSMLVIEYSAATINLVQSICNQPVKLLGEAVVKHKLQEASHVRYGITCITSTGH